MALTCRSRWRLSLPVTCESSKVKVRLGAAWGLGVWGVGFGVWGVGFGV